MDAKEKAKELVNKFLPHAYCGASEEDDERAEFFNAKQCALIAVDEIIDALTNVTGNTINGEYWQQVKSEIEKL